VNVLFGRYRCGCTDVQPENRSIPTRCHLHGQPLMLHSGGPILVGLQPGDRVEFGHRERKASAKS
jgi:hypothetical protein